MARPRARGQSSIHTDLVQQLKHDLTTDQFESLKEKCKSREYGGLGAGQLEKIITIPKLLEILEQKRIFKEGSYQKLKELLRSIELHDAVERVEEAEKELFAAGCAVDGYPPPGSQPMAPGGPMGPPGEQYKPPGPPPYHSIGPSAPTGGYGQPMMQQSHSFIPHQPLQAQGGIQHQSDAFPSFHHPSQYTPTGVTPGHGGMGHHVSQPHIPPQGYNPNTNHSNHMPQRRDTYDRGRAFILFINNHFKSPRAAGLEQYEYREGADKDTETVRRTYQTYLSHHKLIIKEDVGKNQFYAILEDARVELNREPSYASFILLISSHGELTTGEDGHSQKETILLEDSSRVTLDEIMERFTADKIPVLIGKPKVFIVQACRGLKMGQGVPDRSDCMGSTSPSDLNSPTGLTRPDNADILIAYATSKGTRAWRNQVEGTWYIYHLFKAIEENSTGEHFTDLLTSVQGQIAERETLGDPSNRAKQMPCYTSTLTKKFVL